MAAASSRLGVGRRGYPFSLSLHAASVKIKAQLELQHADNPSDVKIDFSTIRRSAVSEVKQRATSRDPEVLAAAASRGRSPGPSRAPRSMNDLPPGVHECKRCLLHCPAHLTCGKAHGKSKSRDKSPASVYSSDAEVLYDEDLADNDRIAVLQAQVARLQTDQREQRLAIQGAFLQDPYVDSDD